MSTNPQPAASRSNLLRLLPVGLFIVMAGVFAFALKSGDPTKLPSALIGKPAPKLTLAPLEALEKDGKPFPGLNAAALATGKPVVVNFWASWCAPCVAEHPVLVQMVRDTGVNLVGINHKDQGANARRFLARYGNPYAAIGTDADGRAAIEWGSTACPKPSCSMARAASSTSTSGRSRPSPSPKRCCRRSGLRPRRRGDDGASSGCRW